MHLSILHHNKTHAPIITIIVLSLLFLLVYLLVEHISPVTSATPSIPAPAITYQSVQH